MTKKVKRTKITKKELEKADPTLLPPTQDIEENLARGQGSIVPDPGDFPGGLDSTLDQQITKRPNIQEATEAAVRKSSKKRNLHKNERK